MAALVTPAKKDLIKDFKFGTLSLRTATSFTDLVAKAVHNRIVRHPIFSDEFLNRYSWMYKGTFQKAIGEGIRYIIPQGIVRTQFFEPNKSGEKVQLEIPYPINEVSEIVGTIGRFAASVRIPDILEAHNIFTDVKTLKAFIASKVGAAMTSIETHLTAYLEYAMSISPWGKVHQHQVLSFGPSYLACVDWDNNNDIKKVFDKIKETFKKEFEDKETNVKNIYCYDALQWYPEQLDEKQANDIKVFNSPSEALTDAENKKLYKDNKEVSPILSIVGVCNAILTHVREMTELSFQNDVNFPGDNEEEIKKYAKTADKTGIQCRCNPNDIIVYMNKALMNIIKSFAPLSNVNTTGTYVNLIHEVSSLNIVGSDLLPYGCIKIFDKNRYSIYSLYDLVGNDKLFQRLVDVYTAHKAIMVAVREKGVPMRVLNISNLYIPPLAMSRVLSGPQKSAIKS